MTGSVTWEQWLAGTGSRTDVPADNSVVALIDQLRHNCSPDGLVDVVCGEHYAVAAGRVSRQHDVEAAAQQYRSQGYVAKIEKASDLGPSVFRVTAMKKLRNLRDVCDCRSIPVHADPVTIAELKAIRATPAP